MRKSQLRQQVNHYLQYNHMGAYRERKHRYFVLHKIIRDLYQIDFVPGKWHAMSHEHVQKLVSHWRVYQLQPSTIMKYMTVLRGFLQHINHHIANIDNRYLGIIQSKKPLKSLDIPEGIADRFVNPTAKLLFEFQAFFGLTLSEAMRLVPDIHIQDNHLLVTRDIASSSYDRSIPIRNEAQIKIVQSFLSLCQPNKNLIATFGYHQLREGYRLQLISHALLSSKTYRYLYARKLYQTLGNTLSNYLVYQTIMREMGIQSRMTLWGYLNE